MSKSRNSITRSEQWKRNWKIVVASFLGASLYGLPFYSFSLFVSPIRDEFGWSSTQIGSAITVLSVATFVLSPLVGPLFDRYRLIQLAIPGVLAYCCAFGLLATLTPNVWHWWSIWLLVGMTASMITVNIWSSAVAKSFVSGRGLAFAITLSGAGVGAIAAPLAANYLIDIGGWRIAYIALAAGYSVLLVPVILFGYSGMGSTDGGATNIAQTVRRVPTEKLLSLPFISLVLACVLISVAVSGSMTHFVPILEASGIRRDDAVLAAGAIGGSALIGRLTMGVLLDQFNPLILGTLAFLLPAVAALALLTQDGVMWAFMAAILLGAAIGAELDVMVFLISRNFGTADYGALVGVIVSGVALGQGIGPLFMGLISDYSGSYDAALWCVVPISVTSALLIIGSSGQFVGEKKPGGG